MTDSVPALALVERMLFGLVSSQIYGPSNARVMAAATEAAEKVATLCRASGAPATVLGAIEHQIVVDSRPPLGASLFAKRLVARIHERGAGGIELGSTVTGADLATLLDLLARRGGATSHVGVNEELAAHHVTSIRLLPPYENVDGDADGDGPRGTGDATPAAEGRDLLVLHQGVVDLLQSCTICACQGRDLDLAQVGSVVEGVVSGLDEDAGELYRLAHYPEHDFFTFGHSIRVGLMAIDVARTMSDDRALLYRVGTAALMHDVGKSLIPWDVLHKRGKLDADERREMQRHPTLGAGILVATKGSDSLAVAAAYGHHRGADGSGYPRSCDEADQTTVTRLVQVCDVFEALTAARPYKAAMTPAKAFRVMLDMKGQFDPTILSHFIRTVGIYPAGTEVRLDDGATARVLRQSGDFHRPVVEVLSDRDGTPVDAGARRPYDLLHPEVGGPSLAVGAVLVPTAVAPLL